MIYDAFLYHNERAILDLRMDVLADASLIHVLVQANVTHRGEPRDPVMIEAPRLKNHIIGLTADRTGFPDHIPDAWVRENRHRNALKDQVATHNPKPDDVILLSDVDEIPNPERLDEACQLARSGWVVVFEQQHSYLRLNLVDPEPWYGTVAIAWKYLLHTTPQAIRYVISGNGRQVLENGGWHLGWIGGNGHVRKKLESFAHAEHDDPLIKSDSYLDWCVKQRVTPHNHHQLLKVGLSKLPKAIQEHEQKYAHLLAL